MNYVVVCCVAAYKIHSHHTPAHQHTSALPFPELTKNKDKEVLQCDNIQM